MKIVMIILLSIHALIHLIGVSRAYHTANGTLGGMMRGEGLLWLSATLLWIAGIILLATDHRVKFLILMCAVVFSQALVQMNWKEAKYGSIINVMVAAWITYLLMS